MGKKKPEKVNKVLCEGVTLSQEFFEQRESRLKVLLLKGFIVYLISMGSIGFYLSAFDIDYNKQLCHLVILVTSMLCAILYYRLLVENLGYLLLLLGFAGLVFSFRVYINSGFYAIVNITVENATQFFGVTVQKLYNEQIQDRYLTVTCAVLFIGFVLNIFINVYISRRMQYVTVSFAVMSLNLIPLYLTEEPDLLYTCMLMAGIAMAYVYKSGSHYSPQVKVKRNDNGFIEKGKDKKKKTSEFFYVSDIKSMLHAGIITTIFVLICAMGVNAFKPKESFNAGYDGNKYKDESMAVMSSLIVDGFEGFFLRHHDVGGMQGGKLGTVSSIKLDNKTDLVVTMAPYTYDRIYLKGFVGEIYNPYENRWTSLYDTNYELDKSICGDISGQYYSAANIQEKELLKQAYEAKEPYSARGRLELELVDERLDIWYEPYYFEYTDSGCEFYPMLSESSILPKPAYNELDLMVPEENVEAIKQTLAEAGVAGTPDRIIEQIMAYYQDNIPYTIRPGKTPSKKDFVNYFLTENKKGYCAHYASAAVLMLRYMGIPARYVEGYAIDYNEFADAQLAEGLEYSDYYDGYNELGETAVVSLDVTDADAHAWVEVYTTTKGWHVVDVTPAGEAEETEDFWDLFEDGMSDEDTDAVNTDLNLNNIRIPAAVVKTVIIALIIAAVIPVIIFIGKKGVNCIASLIRLKNATINDKLIYEYSAYRQRLSRKDKTFAGLISYDSQLAYIYDRNRDEALPDIKTITDILERAGYSGELITQDEYNCVKQFMDVATI